MRRFLVGAGVIAGWLTGCGGGHASRVSVDDFPDAVRDAVCRHLVACGELADLDGCAQVNIPGAVVLDTPAAVVFDAPVAQVMHLGEGVRAATFQAAMKRGDTSFDEVTAAVCVDAIAQASCDVTSQSQRTLWGVCAQSVMGTRGDGASCSESFECRSQSCARVTCHEVCCPGTCSKSVPAEPARLGESCLNADCGLDGFCDHQTWTCQGLKPAGASCQITDECAFGLACGLAPGTVCQGLPALGEACTGSCHDEGAWCDPRSATCVKLLFAGEPCDSGRCSVAYVCDATHHCSLGIAVGAPCTVDQLCAGDRAFCDAPDGLSGTCSLPKAEGSPCRDYLDCASWACDDASNLCTAGTVCP